MEVYPNSSSDIPKLGETAVIMIMVVVTCRCKCCNRHVDGISHGNGDEGNCSDRKIIKSNKLRLLINSANSGFIRRKTDK